MKYVLFHINAIVCGALIFVTTHTGGIIESLVIIAYVVSIMTIYGCDLLQSCINEVQTANNNTEVVINALFCVVVANKRAARRKTRQTHRAYVRAIKAHRKSVKKARRLNRR